MVVCLIAPVLAGLGPTGSTVFEAFADAVVGGVAILAGGQYPVVSATRSSKMPIYEQIISLKARRRFEKCELDKTRAASTPTLL